MNVWTIFGRYHSTAVVVNLYLKFKCYQHHPLYSISLLRKYTEVPILSLVMCNQMCVLLEYFSCQMCDIICDWLLENRSKSHIWYFENYQFEIFNQL